MPEYTHLQRKQVVGMLSKSVPPREIAREVGVSIRFVYSVKRAKGRPDYEVFECRKCGRVRRIAAGHTYCGECFTDRVIEDELDQKFISGLNGDIDAVYRALKRVTRGHGQHGS